MKKSTKGNYDIVLKVRLSFLYLNDFSEMNINKTKFKNMLLKGQSHEIKVCSFWAQWIDKIFLIFPLKGYSSFYQRFHA